MAGQILPALTWGGIPRAHALRCNPLHDAFLYAITHSPQEMGAPVPRTTSETVPWGRCRPLAGEPPPDSAHRSEGTSSRTGGHRKSPGRARTRAQAPGRSTASTPRRPGSRWARPSATTTLPAGPAPRAREPTGWPIPGSTPAGRGAPAQSLGRATEWIVSRTGRRGTCPGRGRTLPPLRCRPPSRTRGDPTRLLFPWARARGTGISRGGRRAPGRGPTGCPGARGRAGSIPGGRIPRRSDSGRASEETSSETGRLETCRVP